MSFEVGRVSELAEAVAASELSSNTSPHRRRVGAVQYCSDVIKVPVQLCQSFLVGYTLLPAFFDRRGFLTGRSDGYERAEVGFPVQREKRLIVIECG